MRDYFGPLASWFDSTYGLSSMPTGMAYPLHTVEVIHLRSTSKILGYHVWATDGDLGILEGFFVSEAGWRLGYLDVKGGDWLQKRSVLVPTGWVQSISWADFVIQLHHPMA